MHIASITRLTEPMTLAQLHRFYETESLRHRAPAQELGVKPLTPPREGRQTTL